MATFTQLQLIQAIEAGQAEDVKLILSENPDFLFKTNIHHESIVHVAAYSSNKEVLEVIYNMLIKYNKTDLLAEPCAKGWTPLHYAVRYNTTEFISCLLGFLGKRAPDLASQITNDGVSPLVLIKANPYGSESQKQMGILLKRYLSEQTLPPLSEKVSQSHYTGNDAQLKSNLKIGIEIANQVRSLIKDSSTHLQSNKYSTALFTKVVTSIDNMRKKFGTSKIQCIKNKSARLHSYCQVIKKHKIGNCGEFAYLALEQLNLKYPEKHGEIYSIKNGDHAFLVIDRDPKSKLDNYKSWGNSVVICDAWSGKVFPAQELPVYLKNYKYFNRINFLESFNALYHKLQRIYFTEPKPLNNNLKTKSVSALQAGSLYAREKQKTKSSIQTLSRPKVASKLKPSTHIQQKTKPTLFAKATQGAQAVMRKKVEVYTLPDGRGSVKSTGTVRERIKHNSSALKHRASWR